MGEKKGEESKELPKRSAQLFNAVPTFKHIQLQQSKTDMNEATIVFNPTLYNIHTLYVVINQSESGNTNTRSALITSNALRVARLTCAHCALCFDSFMRKHGFADFSGGY